MCVKPATRLFRLTNQSINKSSPWVGERWSSESWEVVNQKFCFWRFTGKQFMPELVINSTENTWADLQDNSVKWNHLTPVCRWGNSIINNNNVIRTRSWILNSWETLGPLKLRLQQIALYKRISKLWYMRFVQGLNTMRTRTTGDPASAATTQQHRASCCPMPNTSPTSQMYLGPLTRVW